MTLAGAEPVCPTCRRTFPAGTAQCPFDSAVLQPPAPPVEDPLIGTTISGKFTIQSRLGSGGMGVVYSALQHGLERLVALKVLATGGVIDVQSQQRFRVEARAASQLRNPHAVKVHDFGVTSEGTLYIAMELVEGEPLRTRMARGRLRVRDAVSIAAQVAEALAEAHAREPKIIHRDIKPDNVMVHSTHDGEPFAVVLDFGLALLTDDPRVTATNAIVGTVAYMAPERMLEGTEIGDRVDVYALGVALFEMLAGQRPFTATRSIPLMQQHLRDAPPSLRALAPELPAALEPLVLQMLAKKPEDRPSALNVRSRLLAVLDTLPRADPAAVTERVARAPVQVSVATSASNAAVARATSGSRGRRWLVAGVSAVALAAGAVIALSGGLSRSRTADAAVTPPSERRPAVANSGPAASDPPVASAPATPTSPPASAGATVVAATVAPAVAGSSSRMPVRPFEATPPASERPRPAGETEQRARSGRKPAKPVDQGPKGAQEPKNPNDVDGFDQAILDELKGGRH